MSLPLALIITALLALALYALWRAEKRHEQRMRSAEDERARFRLALELARSSSSNVVAFRASAPRARRRAPRAS